MNDIVLGVLIGFVTSGLFLAFLYWLLKQTGIDFFQRKGESK